MERRAEINVRIRFIFRGRMDVASFEAFAVHRATRLGLGLTLGACTPSACEMTVTGQHALVDAFEMAMSLGPHDCLVLEVDRVMCPARELI